MFLGGRAQGRAYYTHEQCTTALTIQVVERLQMGTEGACGTRDYHPYVYTLREGTAWVLLVLAEQTTQPIEPSPLPL